MNYKKQKENKVKLSKRMITIYSLLGSTSSLVFGILGWYVLHLQYRWWFFGL